MNTLIDDFCRMRLKLAHDFQASPDDRFAVLQEMRELMGQPDAPVPLWDFTDTILGAIRLEISKPIPQRSDFLMMELLRSLKNCCPHVESAPILAAISDHCSDPQTKKLAYETMMHMNPSLQRVWDETIADQISDLSSRACRLDELRMLRLTSMETIHGIFNEMKAVKVERPEDPRLPLVNAYLSDECHEVRSAAAFALLQSM